VKLAQRIVAEGLSVRAIEGQVQEILRADEDDPLADDDGVSTAVADSEGDDDLLSPAAPAATKRKPGRPATKRTAQVQAVEAQLRRALGTKVVVHANGKGAGRIVIPFGDLEEFQRLLRQITG
jgi:hypothetical protein